MLGILPLTEFILALRAEVVATFVTPSISPLTLFILV